LIMNSIKINQNRSQRMVFMLKAYILMVQNSILKLIL